MNDALGMQPPKYKSHKTVTAFRIKNIQASLESSRYKITPLEDGYEPFEVSAAYVAKHDPQVGGYHVRYEDGYESYSPAAAFEAGYTLIEEGDDD